MKKLYFIGIDSWNRSVYSDESWQLWKDVNLGSGIPALHSMCNNDFDGEPDMPIDKNFKIMKGEI